MNESPKCPGCGVRMNNSGTSGNWRVYSCKEQCSFEVERSLVSDHGGMTIESLQSIQRYNDEN